MSQNLSRRGFLGVAGVSALADPAGAAAQAVGIKRGDLPDLTIKEVRVYVLKDERRPAASGARSTNRVEHFAAAITNSGIEGNYIVPTRYSHSNWSNLRSEKR